MKNVLTRRLELLWPLDQDEEALLAGVVEDPYTLKAHQDLIREGDIPNDVHLIVSGIACRYKVLRNGGRQIMAYLLPGDFCHLHVFILDRMDHTISTLTDCTVVSIPRETILRLTERPAIARALWWATLVDESILREALVNMGRRRAEERVAHFLCEMLTRFEAVGLVTDNRFDFSVTQFEFGDTLGLSTVHINRTLQQLRHKNLIACDRKGVTILDVEALKALCDFNPNYLHLGHQRPKADGQDVRRRDRPAFS